MSNHSLSALLDQISKAENQCATPSDEDSYSYLEENTSNTSENISIEMKEHDDTLLQGYNQFPPSYSPAFLKKMREKDMKCHKRAKDFLSGFIDKDPNLHTEKKIKLIKRSLKFMRKFKRIYVEEPKCYFPIERILLPTTNPWKVKATKNCQNKKTNDCNTINTVRGAGIETRDVVKEIVNTPDHQAAFSTASDTPTTYCKTIETTTGNTIEFGLCENFSRNIHSPVDNRIAIIDRSDPAGTISHYNWLIVEGRLRDIILNDTGVHNKQFGSAYSYKGVKVITCANKESLDFLVQTISNLDNLWDGSQLSAVSIADIPYTATLTAWIPPPQIDAEHILKILEKQNPNLQTSNWKVIKSSSSSEKGGQTIHVIADKEGESYLKQCNGKLNFGLGSIRFRLEKKK